MGCRTQAQDLRPKIDQPVVVVVGKVMERNVDGHYFFSVSTDGNLI